MANLNITQEKLDALRSEYKHRNVRGKYPRQKMLPEYQALYPWIIPDTADPYYSFCIFCECRLNAKRSDLKKHEGSIKHTENVAKKQLEGIELKQQIELPETVIPENGENEEEISTAGTDDEGFYIKQEPEVELVEHNKAIVNLELNENSHSYSQSLESEGEEDEEDDDDGNDNDNDNDSTYEPCVKRSALEGDLHSNPMQVTVSESSTIQRFAIREISPAYTNSSGIIHNTNLTPYIHYTQATSPMLSMTQTQTPCTITIKKITAPMLSNQVTSAATITPVPSSITISQQPKPIASLKHSTNLTSSQSTVPILRDSFDLFFDSICATVKSLPPKLATEGKIRVMQLIGELEIRAITEREQEGNGTNNVSVTQENATVASTTK